MFIDFENIHLKTQKSQEIQTSLLLLSIILSHLFFCVLRRTFSCKQFTTEAYQFIPYIARIDEIYEAKNLLITLVATFDVFDATFVSQ